jgi:hypothetical protein
MIGSLEAGLRALFGAGPVGTSIESVRQNGFIPLEEIPKLLLSVYAKATRLDGMFQDSV